MRHTIKITLIISFLLLSLAACVQEETALPTRAALAEVDVSTSDLESSETVDETNADVLSVDSETITGERPLLPNLATAPIESGIAAGLGGNITIAEGDNAGETSMLAPDVANLFDNASFSLDTTLPTDAIEAQVWQQPAVLLDINRAKAIAQRWGFTGPLYTFAIPGESIVGEAVGLEAAQLPVELVEFHAFDGTRSLVITESSAYFSDNSVPFDYETPRPFDERVPAAETVLQSMGLLDFPYTLANGWGHEVWVNRVLDELKTDYPEISVGVNDNGRLAFASYQPFDQLAVVGTYPLISAETAWQQIQDGIDEDILFTISASTDEQEFNPDPLSLGFQYWPREHQTTEEIHLYTYPTVFLPVDEGLPPLIHAQNYTIQTDDDTLRALAEQLGVNIHFWGMIDKRTNALALTGWEPMPDLNPLIKNGTIQQQGEQTVLIDQEGNPFILPDAPSDLTDGSQVNVFAWATRDAGQSYPVLDWEGIDMQIAGSSGETIAMPESLPPVSPVYEQISINNAELAYYVYPEFQATENGRFQQSFLLLPVWQFTATADNGDTVQFTVQATE